MKEEPSQQILRVKYDTAIFVQSKSRNTPESSQILIKYSKKHKKSVT